MDVVVVHDGDFVGVAALTEAQAERALAAIRTQWKESPKKVSDREIFDYLKQNASPGSDARREKQQKGSISEGLANAAHKLESSYTVAYIAHVPLEPRAAVALWRDNKMTVWTGTQRPFAVRAEVANALHIPESSVRVIVPDTGSAYGGKHTGDAAVEAARLAKAANRPVKLVWTREEEFTWAYFRPSGLIEVKSAIDAGGKLTAWEFHNYHSGSSGIETPYDVPNQLIQYHSVPLVLRCGSYRGLAATANHFARESHMDELARAANRDPLEFRLGNLSDPRLTAVLEAAAKKFGWPQKKSKEGQGFRHCRRKRKGKLRCHLRRGQQRSRIRQTSRLSAWSPLSNAGPSSIPTACAIRSSARTYKASVVRFSNPFSSKTVASKTRIWQPIASLVSATCRKSKRFSSTAKTFPPRAPAKLPSWRLLPP
jgi:isoquinoline 1-oxidoreductase